MKRMILTAALAVLMVSVFPAAFASHSTPFNGNMSGNSVAISQTSNSIRATVMLEHLGKSQLVGTTTVTGQTECRGFVGTEKDTITAANDDQIFISGNGTSCPTSPTVFQDTVSFTITGGTGHFAHASGSGTIHTTIDITSLTTATFTATISGSIAY